MYRKETLTLSKLMDIVRQYYDKEALILSPEGQVILPLIQNNSRRKGLSFTWPLLWKMWAISVGNVGKSAVLKCNASPNRLRNVRQTLNEASFAEIAVKNKNMEVRDEICRANVMYAK